ncbi:MAG: hypothetical protein V8Q82_04970 [Christensenellales bacterium]
MAEFAPGMRVLIRDEEWMIRKCDLNSYNTYTLQCVGVSPLVRDKTAYFLGDLEKIAVIDPAKTTLVPDSSTRFTRSRLFLESLWRQKIPTDAKLHVGHHAVMDVMPYQLEPAAMSLSRPRQRILMADGVGLGKTLEAGILISELIARGKGPSYSGCDCQEHDGAIPEGNVGALFHSVDQPGFREDSAHSPGSAEQP